MKGPHGTDFVQLISTTDFFYPLVEDPYIQGRIACANTLSDVYAMGIDRVDHMLMVLAIALKMNEKEREIVTREMIRGFNDCATEAGTKITGGQSIMNPWPIIGGVANVVCHESEYIKVNQAMPGDKLLLTKPLGTQVAVNLNEWMLQKNERWTDEASKYFTEERAKEAYYMSVESMAHINMNAAALMKKYSCHGATDITGFGIKGHAENLVHVQREDVDFRIHSLPIIDGMEVINEHVLNFKLTDGYSAETSGGLLAIVPPDALQDMQRDLLHDFGQESWVVGDVVKGSRQVQWGKNKAIDIINVETSFLSAEK